MLIKNKIMSDSYYNLETKFQQEQAERKIWMYTFAVVTGLLIGFVVQYMLIMNIFQVPAF